MNIFKLDDNLEKGLTFFVIVVFALKILLTFSQVIFRRVPMVSFVWSEELARYSLVWITYVGGALGIKKGVHVAVEAAVNYLFPSKKRFIKLIHYVLFIIFSSILVIWGTQLSLYNLAQPSPALGLPIGTIYMAIPISGLFIIIFSLLEIFKSIKAERPGEGDK